MTTTATEDTKRVLELLAQGRITVDEADQLLRAMKEPSEQPAAETRTAETRTARWMRITIEKAARDGRPAKTVTIRVPVAFARSGLRLGAMFPHVFGPKLKEEFRKQGIDFDFSKLDLGHIEPLLNDLGETTIDVNDGQAQIRIRCE